MQIPAGSLGTAYVPWALLTIAAGCVVMVGVGILEEKGIEATDRGVVIIAMNKLREVLLESPEALDNARLTADGESLYLVKNRRLNISSK